MIIGRAWKAKRKSGEERHNLCHAVKEGEETLCGKFLDETWIYDEETEEIVTCSKCKQNMDV